MSKKTLFSLAILLGCSLCWNHLCGAESRKWTSVDGKYTVVGEMLSVTNGIVVIRKQGQAEPIRVPLEKLSQADRDYAIRKSQSTVMEVAPLPETPDTATAPVSAQPGPDGDWNLNAKLVIKLPPGARQWEVQSASPLVFVAESQQGKFPQFLSVDFRGPHEMQQVRLQLLNNAQDDSVRILREQGAIVENVPAAVTGNVPPRFTVSIPGKLMDGTAVQCNLLVRFDPQGIFLYRAVGEPKFVNAAMSVASRATYLAPQAAMKPSRGTPPLTEAEMTSKSLPEDKEKSLKEFVKKIQELLQSGDDRKLIETIADPEDLKQILTRIPIETLAKEFAAGNKEALQKSIDQIDWSSVEYTPLAKQVSLLTKSGNKPLVFVETDSGWRLKN